MMRLFFHRSFLTTIWCPKHFQGMYFHPPLLTWKYLENSWKLFFLKFWHFFKFYSFLRIFSLLKYVPKNDLNKNWTDVSSNESVLPKMINFEQIIESIFQNLIFGRSDSLEDTSVQSLFKSFFVHNLVRKTYVKMTKIWKNAKISTNFFFMNSRNIFMWVMVDENTSPGSVLDTILWSESLYCKKPPSFLTSRKFTHFFSELLNLIRYFRTFGQQVLT